MAMGFDKGSTIHITYVKLVNLLFSCIIRRMHENEFLKLAVNLEWYTNSKLLAEIYNTVFGPFYQI